MLILALIVLPIAAWCILIFLAASHRRPGPGGRVSPIDGWDVFTVMSRETYSPAGQKYLPWLWAALLALLVCGFLALRILAKTHGL